MFYVNICKIIENGLTNIYYFLCFITLFRYIIIKKVLLLYTPFKEQMSNLKANFELSEDNG